MVITSKFGQFVDYNQHKTKDAPLVDSKVNHAAVNTKKRGDKLRFERELDKLDHGDYYSDFVV